MIVPANPSEPAAKPANCNVDPVTLAPGQPGAAPARWGDSVGVGGARATHGITPAPAAVLGGADGEAGGGVTPGAYPQALRTTSAIETPAVSAHARSQPRTPTCMAPGPFPPILDRLDKKRLTDATGPSPDAPLRDWAGLRIFRVPCCLSVIAEVPVTIETAEDRTVRAVIVNSQGNPVVGFALLIDVLVIPLIERPI